MVVALTSSKVLRTLRNLPPRHFEQFVADVWQEKQGWDTKVSDPGSDGGLDVIGQPPGGGSRTALQCKRYSKGRKIGSRQVREYAALRQRWDVVEGVTIVTTSSFTKAAEEEAEKMDVNCLDGEDLVRLIERYNAGEILEWYAAGKPEDW